MESVKSFCQSHYVCIAIGGAVVVLSVPIIKALCSGSRRRVDVSKYPRDKVTLFGIPRAPYAPSMSPFPLKLETYLRMAKVPYQSVVSLTPSSKGKTPWMIYDGQEIADSHFCIQYINRKLKIDLNVRLSEEDRAVARAFQMMTEDHLYWVLGLSRWKYGIDEEEGYAFLKMALKGYPMTLAKVFSKTFTASAHAQGIGRHSEEEVMNLGEGDIRALSDFLGNKSFLMGEEPCEEDCSIFGMLAQLYWQIPGPLQKLVKEDCGNLAAYCERMKERFWPDWEDCITHGGTREATK